MEFDNTIDNISNHILRTYMPTLSGCIYPLDGYRRRFIPYLKKKMPTLRFYGPRWIKLQVTPGAFYS
jgi:hypothetical protein